MRTSIVGLLLLALSARAQEAAAPEEQPRKLNEIERGLYARGVVGPLFLFSTPGAGGGFTPGAAGGVEMGLDLGESLQVGLFVLGGGHSAPASYKGKNGAGRGDFETLLAGASGRLALGWIETDAVPRTQLFVRAAVGMFASTPDGVLGDTGVAFLAGPGIEYNTRLRRFAVSLSADALVAPGGPAYGGMLTGSLRYTF